MIKVIEGRDTYIELTELRLYEGKADGTLILQ